MSSDFTWRRAVALAAILAMATVGVASAQRSGSIYGTVKDDSGSSLPGVTVHLEGMGAPRTTVTDDAGNYRFLGLDPGAYYVKAELDGFSTVEQPNVVVALNRNTTINATGEQGPPSNRSGCRRANTWPLAKIARLPAGSGRTS